MRHKWLPSHKTQVAIVTGIVVALIGAWVTHFLGPRPVAGTQLFIAGHQTTEKTVAERLAESRISLTDWQGLVKTNLDREQRKRVFERYRGERVTWQGYFSEFNPISPAYATSSGVNLLLVMYEDKETLNLRALGRAPALCVFPIEAEAKLQELARGQRIVVQGTFAAATLHGELLGTKLYNCELLEP